jgi:hypothetical protein
MFKSRGKDDGGASKEQAVELKELIDTAREERAALSTMLTQTSSTERSCRPWDARCRT